MRSTTVQSVAVATREASMEIEVRGSRPHIGKSIASEIARRALAAHGFHVTVDSQDGDSDMFKARTDLELRQMAAGLLGKLNPKITILDKNVRTQGSK